MPEVGQCLDSHLAPDHLLTHSLSSGSAVVTLGPYPAIIEKQVSPFLQPCALKAS